MLSSQSSSQDAAAVLSVKQYAVAASPTRTVNRDLSIILPLSLVRRLVEKLNHPGPGTELKELDPLKGLGEQVRKLVLGVDVARLDAPFLKTASDEVVPHLDVLAAFVEHGVLC